MKSETKATIYHYCEYCEKATATYWVARLVPCPDPQHIDCKGHPGGPYCEVCRRFKGDMA